MKADPFPPRDPNDADLPPSWREALRTLPSEHGAPRAEVDAAILAAARDPLAAIRRRKLRRRLGPALAAAACGVLAVTWFSAPPAQPESQAATPSEDPYARILREVSAVFPRQIAAITSDDGELQIALADEPHSEDLQAVVIEILERDDHRAVITYVGQTVEVGSRRVTISTDERGRIVIDPPNPVGPGANPSAPPPEVRIKTRKI